MTNPLPGFAEAKQSAYVIGPTQTLIGQFRRLGSAGPAYEVMSVSEDGQVVIEIVHSNERLTEALPDVLADPVADTLP
jgi:hypothetical protein